LGGELADPLKTVVVQNQLIGILERKGSVRTTVTADLV
jgi:hypothetical protein